MYISDIKIHNYIKSCDLSRLQRILNTALVFSAKFLNLTTSLNIVGSSFAPYPATYSL